MQSLISLQIIQSKSNLYSSVDLGECIAEILVEQVRQFRCTDTDRGYWLHEDGTNVKWEPDGNYYNEDLYGLDCLRILAV